MIKNVDDSPENSHTGAKMRKVASDYDGKHTYVYGWELLSLSSISSVFRSWISLNLLYKMNEYYSLVSHKPDIPVLIWDFTILV